MEKVNVVVGDIHGCLIEFDELLKTISYNSSTMRLILLGDLIHRGPDQAELIKLVRHMNIECVKGNHEESAGRWIKHHRNEVLSGKKNPMKTWDPDDKDEALKLSDDDWNWMNKLPLKIHIKDNVYAVHAGCEPRFTLDRQIPAQIMRVRYVNEKGVGQDLNADKSKPDGTVFWTEKWNGPESIVYGHYVQEGFKPRLDEYNGYFCLGIDTGCVFGGNLTAAVLNDKIEFVSVKAKKTYVQL